MMNLTSFLHPFSGLNAVSCAAQIVYLVQQERHAPPPVHETSARFSCALISFLLFAPLQVKTQFGNDPYVYNGFLKVMKQFKAQEIETKVRTPLLRLN
jgi:hypothetical protein